MKLSKKAVSFSMAVAILGLMAVSFPNRASAVPPGLIDNALPFIDPINAIVDNAISCSVNFIWGCDKNGNALTAPGTTSTGTAGCDTSKAPNAAGQYGAHVDSALIGNGQTLDHEWATGSDYESLIYKCNNGSWVSDYQDGGPNTVTSCMDEWLYGSVDQIVSCPVNCGSATTAAPTDTQPTNNLCSNGGNASSVTKVTQTVSDPCANYSDLGYDLHDDCSAVLGNPVYTEVTPPHWYWTCTGASISTRVSCTAPAITGTVHNLSVSAGKSVTVTSNDPSSPINCSFNAGSCSKGYVHGASVTLKAVVSSGNDIFSGWLGACPGSKADTCTFTMNSNETVTAASTCSPSIDKSATTCTTDTYFNGCTNVPGAVDCTPRSTGGWREVAPSN